MPPPLSNACTASLESAIELAAQFPVLASLLGAAAVAFAAEDYPVGLGLLVAAYNRAVNISQIAAQTLNDAILCIRLFLQGFGGQPSPGGGNVACNTTHSSKVQGAGICCAAVQSGALTVPPPGTTLPAYTPGQAATLPAGRRTQVVDAGGHCSTCMIVGSSSRKHPGRPVLRFIRGGPGCPTSGTGCCAMTA